jgi:hypothetical protein
MVRSGTAPGVRNMMALDGCINMGKVVMESTGTHTSERKPGMRATHIMGLKIVMRARCS